MPGIYSLTVRDFSDETSDFTVHIPTITALNHDATVTATTALKAAIDALILGQDAKTRIVARDVAISAAAATDENAQIERRWRVFYHDTSTGKKYRCDIPTAKLTGELVAGTDRLDVGAGTDGEDFVNAFEAIVVSEVGNPVVVDKVIHTGKNV